MDLPSTLFAPPTIMLRYLPYFIIFFLTLGIMAVLQSYRPDLMNEVLISFDVFGISESARNEQQRKERISALPITYEEKQVLIGRTVFLGASIDMVRLAVGEPMKAYQRNIREQNLTITYLVYYLPSDKRPTIMEFHNDKLEKAYKGSAIDLQ